jgi:caffeoyl-CoA O-methyltransferase
MANRTIELTPELYEYVLAHVAPPPDDVERWLIEETRSRVDAFAGMQIAPDQGAFMGLIARVIGARHAVEVGTFTGYSALCVARALPPDGRLLCCDVSEEWTAIGREAWERAGVADRIDLRIAPAIETLRALPQEERFDLAFIDADKTGYASYYDEILPRLHPNALLLVDNVLWGGAVVDESAHDDDTEAIRAFNDMVTADERVDSVIAGVGDGLTLVRKR